VDETARRKQKLEITEANFPRASGQLRAKPPVFASKLREQLFELENEDVI
jgi:hypothetical protein